MRGSIDYLMKLPAELIKERRRPHVVFLLFIKSLERTFFYFFYTMTNETTAAATAEATPPTAPTTAPATKRKQCAECGKSHTGDCWPLCGACKSRHPADKECARRRPPRNSRGPPRQPPRVVNNYNFSGDGYAVTVYAHPSPAGAAPPPAKRRKGPKAKKDEEKKDEEKEKSAEGPEPVKPAAEGKEPSSK
ncbi:hypothetical protein CNMCM5793_006956 [Aspergillus hiratsukae]|uniref:Uncharacterized protein n=1 Tax=Aspergillus hiratsukae TaxID=1194566 RepID=A0A8H6UH55_9EURO|nr:hypothetical protein CNMCM5793_006956 [Aspergillus hiratsukae]KAF7173877.1 hypothetical protein CNMCM6106_007958 [Aspergillus hiratsukae]